MKSIKQHITAIDAHININILDFCAMTPMTMSKYLHLEIALSDSNRIPA
jgi:hypothetical protein